MKLEFYFKALSVLFNSEVNCNWFSSLVNNKKHISFFLQLEQPFGTELLVYSFVEQKLQGS